eukprot:scaffold43159_cov63-Phaeocystis_antarctica.AAC.2
MATWDAAAGENGGGVAVAAASIAGDRGGVPVALAAEGDRPAKARSPLMRAARSICCLRLMAQSCAATELRFARFASLASWAERKRPRDAWDPALLVGLGGC